MHGLVRVSELLKKQLHLIENVGETRPCPKALLPFLGVQSEYRRYVHIIFTSGPHHSMFTVERGIVWEHLTVGQTHQSSRATCGV